MKERIPTNHQSLIQELINQNETLSWKVSSERNEIMCKVEDNIIKIFKESENNFGFQIFDQHGFLQEGSQAMGNSHPDVILMKQLFNQVLSNNNQGSSTLAIDLLQKLKSKKNN